MTFKTTLFKAISAAHTSYCNGHTVEARYLNDSPAALLKPYVDLSNNTTVQLDNQEIQVDEEGRAYCRAKLKDESSEPLVWTFKVMSPLKLSDMPEEQLTVEDVRKALGASNDWSRRSA